MHTPTQPGLRTAAWHARTFGFEGKLKNENGSAKPHAKGGKSLPSKCKSTQFLGLEEQLG
jgi:hypothetical protein